MRLVRALTDHWSGEQLQALRDQGLSYVQITKRTGLTYSQLQNRLYR